MKLQFFLSRLSWPAFCVVMLLQRSPLVRYLAQVEHSLIPRIQHIWTVVVGAVTVGAYNSVTAASGDVEFAPNGDKTTVELGETVQIVFRIESGRTRSPGDWDITGELPAGVVKDENNGSSTSTISGTPTESGSFPIKVQAWEDPNMQGDKGADLDFILVVNPLITQQPIAQSVDLGATVELSVMVGDPEGVSFQWQKQNADNSEEYDDLEGQTGNVINLETVELEDAGNYRVIAMKGEISEISDPVIVTVNPLISQDPSNQAGDWGGTAELSVELAVSEGATFQWQKRNAEDPDLFDDLPGETGPVLDFTVLSSNDAGDYRVVATVGSIMQVSSAATLNVNATAFQMWKDIYFEDPFSEDAALDQNPDQDELINAVEFAFGLDPNAMQKEALVKSTHEDIEGVVHAVFTFPPLSGGSDITVSLEGNATPSEVGWTTLVNGVEGVIIESTVEGYIVKVPASPRTFNRLRVVTNES